MSLQPEIVLTNRASSLPTYHSFVAMPRFLRVFSYTIGASAVLVALLLFVRSEPAYGLMTHTPLLLDAGLVLIGGFFWTVTWWSLADLLERVRAIADVSGNQQNGEEQ